MSKSQLKVEVDNETKRKIEIVVALKDSTIREFINFAIEEAFKSKEYNEAYLQACSDILKFKN